MRIDIERLIHSLKTAIACIIAYLFTYLLGNPENDPWIIITVIVVMCAQIYVGSVLQKGALRFLGTLIGCLLATTSLLLFGHSTLITISTIAFATLVFSFIATGTETLSYAGTLGAVTTTIILIGQTPTPMLAAQRFLEITLGILIATLISQFILPIHARTHLKRAQAQTLEQFHKLYSESIINHHLTNEADYLEREQTTITSLLRQQKLTKESRHELLGGKLNPEHVISTIQCEREILRAISFMHHALAEMNIKPETLQTLTALNTFNNTTLASLTTLSKALDAKNVEEMHIHTPDMTTLQNAIMPLVNQSQDQIMYAEGFLFSADILSKAIAKLAGIFGVLTYDVKS